MLKQGDLVVQCYKFNERDLCHAQNIIKEVLDVVEQQPTTVTKEGKKQSDKISCSLNSNSCIARNFLIV